MQKILRNSKLLTQHPTTKEIRSMRNELNELRLKILYLFSEEIKPLRNLMKHFTMLRRFTKNEINKLFVMDLPLPVQKLIVDKQGTDNYNRVTIDFLKSFLENGARSQ